MVNYSEMEKEILSEKREKAVEKAEELAESLLQLHNKPRKVTLPQFRGGEIVLIPDKDENKIFISIPFAIVGEYWESEMAEKGYKKTEGGWYKNIR